MQSLSKDVPVYNIILKNLAYLDLCFMIIRFILGDIQQCYNTLLEACCEYEIVELVSKNPYADAHHDVRHALLICIFNFCVLGEIGNSKSNVIAVSKHNLLQPLPISLDGT